MTLSPMMKPTFPFVLPFALSWLSAFKAVISMFSVITPSRPISSTEMFLLCWGLWSREDSAISQEKSAHCPVASKDMLDFQLVGCECQNKISKGKAKSHNWFRQNATLPAEPPKVNFTWPSLSLVACSVRGYREKENYPTARVSHANLTRKGHRMGDQVLQ